MFLTTYIFTLTRLSETKHPEFCNSQRGLAIATFCIFHFDICNLDADKSFVHLL